MAVPPAWVSLPNQLIGVSVSLCGVLREGVAAVVHHRPVVVGSDLIAVVEVLIEIEFVVVGHVRPVDVDEVLAVLAGLLVPQPDGVAYLVDDGRRVDAKCRGANRLGAPDASDGAVGRRLGDAEMKDDVVVLEHPRDESDVRFGVPLVDGRQDERAS